MTYKEGALIDVFKTDEPVIDQWTFVFAGRDHLTGYYPMLGTDNTGFGFSQSCEGMYDPDGDNSYLGERPRYVSEALLNHVLERMTNEP